MSSRLSFTKADFSAAVFGAWDGCISVLAVLIAAHSIAPGKLLLAGLGGAIGGSFSMATGQFESMDGSTSLKTRESVIMGLFTLAGGLLPALPFLLGDKKLGFVIGAALSVVLATVVWMLKKEGLVGAFRAYALLILTAAATIAVSLIVS